MKVSNYCISDQAIFESFGNNHIIYIIVHENIKDEKGKIYSYSNPKEAHYNLFTTFKDYEVDQFYFDNEKIIFSLMHFI